MSSPGTPRSAGSTPAVPGATVVATSLVDGADVELDDTVGGAVVASAVVDDADAVVPVSASDPDSVVSEPAHAADTSTTTNSSAVKEPAFEGRMGGTAVQPT
jgi:hypothetical protein